MSVSALKKQQNTNKRGRGDIESRRSDCIVSNLQFNLFNLGLKIIASLSSHDRNLFYIIVCKT